jgi:hypothetical protein
MAALPLQLVHPSPWCIGSLVGMKGCWLGGCCRQCRPRRRHWEKGCAWRRMVLVAFISYISPTSIGVLDRDCDVCLLATLARYRAGPRFLKLPHC